MNLSLLTYNTLFNKAYEQIGQIINQASPDIICLQEVDISIKNLEVATKFGYKLADYSGTFIKFGKGFGVVTYYNPKKLKLIDTHSLKIGSNLLELFFAIPQLILGINKPKSILRTDFIWKASGKKTIICNSHLIVIAPNNVRIKHINQALNSLKISHKMPLVIAGDFNYLPYHRRKLDNVMKKYDLVEATKNIKQTVNFSPKGKKEHFSLLQGFFIRRINHFFGNQMKNDYIYYRGIKHVKTSRLEVRFSDHYPIISHFSL